MTKRGRFAPSPTGPLHFGSLISAVGSFLQASSQNATWQVRIEDVDTPRIVTGAAHAILTTLENHGLYWDGNVTYQSTQTERYEHVLQQLMESGLAYFCTCSRRDLARIAKPGASGRIYPGLCRNGPQRPYQQRPPSIRLRTDNRLLRFHDGIQGDFTQHLESEVGDFVIRRADGVFAYQLAVVIDDADQGITDIVRGSDLLDSTPRQIYLQQLLGYPTPIYYHLPVAVKSDGAKLSKQTGAPPLDERTPVANIFSVLKFLQQAPPAELECADLASLWDWAKRHWDIAKIPAVLQKESRP